MKKRRERTERSQIGKRRGGGDGGGGGGDGGSGDCERRLQIERKGSPPFHEQFHFQWKIYANLSRRRSSPNDSATNLRRLYDFCFAPQREKQRGAYEAKLEMARSREYSDRLRLKSLLRYRQTIII